MKKIYFILLSGLVATFGCVPEDDSFFATSFGDAASVTVQANLAYIKDVSSEAKLPIGLAGKSEAKDIQSVKLYVEFVASGEATTGTDELLTETTTYPDTVEVAEATLLDLAGVSSVNNLTAGDKWIIRYQVTLKGGRVLTVATRSTISFTCPSDLAGTYFGETDYGASQTVTIIAMGNGLYQISDFEIDFFAGGPYTMPARFTDICGNITLTEESLGGFGEVFSGSGSYDPDSETITISWSELTYVGDAEVFETVFTKQ